MSADARLNAYAAENNIPLDTDRMVPEEEPQDPPAPGTPEPAAKRIKRDIDSGRKRNRIENMPKPPPGAPRHTAKIKDGLLRPRTIDRSIELSTRSFYKLPKKVLVFG